MTIPFNLASFADKTSSTGTANPSAISDVANTSTGAIGFPVGTTAQRNGTPVNGMIRINSTTSVLEVYYNGSWVTISTFTPPGPTVIGEAYGGGYYAGKISATGNGVATHYLIISPRATGQSADNAYNINNINDPGATSLIDGPANTNALNDANHPLAQFCKNLTIGGYNDWYMPALNEMITIYYFLKPTTNANNTSYGSNVNAVSPQPISTYYTSGSPAQTTVALFQDGGSEALTGYNYFPSTQYSSSQAYAFLRLDGSYSPIFKNSYLPCRAVRRIPI